MNSSISVSVVTSIVLPSPQISPSGPTTTNSTDNSSKATTTNPRTQTSSNNENNIANNVNSIVGIVVGLSIAFCILFVGAMYICCRARRRRKNMVIKTYGQDFSSPDNETNNTPIPVKKLPIIQEPSMAKVVNRRDQTHSTATSVSRYSTIFNQVGPSFHNAMPANRLMKNKRYDYF